MHAFSIDSVLHSPNFVEDDGTFATVHYEGETSEDDARHDETTTDLTKSVEEPFYHI